MAVPTYTKSGTKATAEVKLDKSVFGEVVKSHDLLKQAYSSYLANGRTNNARTKTRGEVRGGGRKPWRQKGTGRARFGSIRVPIWRGGGITFGPTGEENYTQSLSTQMKRKAIRQALSLAATEKRIHVIETFDFKDNKTSAAVKLLDKIGAKGRTLLVVDEKSAAITRATSNLSNVNVVAATYINVFDAVNADTIVITKKALDMVHEWLGGKK